MAGKSIKLNAIMSSLKTVMSMVISLVTFPYISRVLLVDALGKHSFAVSIVSYFILLAELGAYTYAVREGTKLRDNKKSISIFANEVLTIQAISMVFSLLLLSVSVAAVPKLREYWLLLLILSAEIPLTALSRSWVYAVYEDYPFLTLTQFAFQIIALISMFLFVRSPDDLYVYTITYVISRAGSGFVYHLHSRKYVTSTRINLSNLKKHMGPILLIFFTAVSTTIYINSDVTILGWLVNDEAVGLYSVSVKIYNVIKQVITAVIAVVIPRLTLYTGTERFETFFNKVAKTLSLIVLPAVTGLFMLSSNVVEMIGGPEYAAATSSMQILSIALGCSLFACLYASGVLIPNMQEKAYMYATIVSAAVNILLNFILVPFFKQDAAAFTTLIAELLMLLLCYNIAKKNVSLKNVKKTILPVGIGCASIIAVCLGIRALNLTLFPETILCVGLSVAAYCGVQFVLKNEAFMQTFHSLVKLFMKKHA